MIGQTATTILVENKKLTSFALLGAVGIGIALTIAKVPVAVAATAAAGFVCLATGIQLMATQKQRVSRIAIGSLAGSLVLVGLGILILL